MDEFSENITPESQEAERPPRNILTHYQETLDAMAEIEGEGWKKRQETTRSGHCLLDALDALQSFLAKNPSEKALKFWDFQVYGSGGGNRYLVRSDGSVEFSAGHAVELASETGHISKDKIIKVVASLGFKIFR